MKNVIDRFKGDYFYLSNFYCCPVEYEGLVYPNSEAAFQAAKNIATDQEVEEYFKKIRVNLEDVSDFHKEKVKLQLTAEKRMPFTEMTPSEAKKAGRRCKLRPDWEEEKYGIMEKIVMNKFLYNPALKDKILETEDAVLIEGNNWGDRIWGMVDGKGKNILGKILMEVRDELQYFNYEE